MCKIKFQDILEYVKDCKKLNTLGGQSEFTVSAEGNELHIINSGKNTFVCNQANFEKVCNRFHQLNNHERGVSSNYAIQRWSHSEGNPNKIYAPYVAALILNYLNPKTFT